MTSVLDEHKRQERAGRGDEDKQQALGIYFGTPQ